MKRGRREEKKREYSKSRGNENKNSLKNYLTK